MVEDYELQGFTEAETTATVFFGKEQIGCCLVSYQQRSQMRSEICSFVMNKVVVFDELQCEKNGQMDGEYQPFVER